MAHVGGVGKHQAELPGKYLPCSLLPWGPGRHPGLPDASWGLVLPASWMQPVSDVTSPQLARDRNPLLGLVLAAIWENSRQEGKGEGDKQINALCSPPPAPSVCASYPAARSSTALPALS